MSSLFSLTMVNPNSDKYDLFASKNLAVGISDVRNEATGRESFGFSILSGLDNLSINVFNPILSSPEFFNNCVLDNDFLVLWPSKDCSIKSFNLLPDVRRLERISSNVSSSTRLRIECKWVSLTREAT